MKTSKIGALFLVSLMVLAGVGVGYAAWIDTLHIYTRVETGSVGWRIVDNSETFVYKVYNCDPGPDPSHAEYGTEIFVDYNSKTYTETINLMNREFPHCTWEMVASAETVTPDDHFGRMLFWNLFPSIDFKADFRIEYFGTVPGKISDIRVSGDQGIVSNYAVWTLEVNGVSYTWDELYGVQLHAGDEIYLVLTIHLPQDPTLMSMPRAHCDIYIDVIQWNEYVPP